MSRVLIVALSLGVAFGLRFSALAEPLPVSGATGGANTEPIAPNPMSPPSASGATSDPYINPSSASTTGSSTHPSTQKPSSSDDSDGGDASGSSNDVQDDTLYRMSTKEALAAGVMGRDEGQLTRKPTRREKVSEVESTKQLKTSGTDPKFQGSLLHSSVTSIEDLGQKASDDAGDKETEPVVEGEARFKAKHLVFSQEESNNSKKKKENSHTKAETSPSPSPSATASAAATNR